MGIKEKTKGNIILTITALVWGTGFIGQKLGMNSLPAAGFNGSRQIMAALVLLPIMIAGLRKSGYLSKEKHDAAALKERKKRALKAGLVCGALMSLGTNLQQLGLMTISAGKSGFISTIYIVLVPIIGVFFGTKLRGKTVLSCAIAMLGFGLLSFTGGMEKVAIGDWLTLGSAICFAVQIIVVNFFVDKNNDLLISVIQMGFTGVSSMIVSLIFENCTLAGFIDCLPVLLYMALIPTAIGYTGQIVGQKYTDSTTASFLLSLESVFSVIFGAILLSETMSIKELFGCVLIFVANIIVQMGGNTSDEKKQAQT